MNVKLKKEEKGFTIIEVLIVLAIAGLIMVIVFLAVPALQRNSRNTQRTADASRIASAVNECMANNNGTVGSCNALGAAQLSNYINLPDNQQLTAAGAAGLNTVSLAFGQGCNAAGTGAGGAANARAFRVEFQLENRTGTGVPRCIAG